MPVEIHTTGDLKCLVSPNLQLIFLYDQLAAGMMALIKTLITMTSGVCELVLPNYMYKMGTGRDPGRL